MYSMKLKCLAAMTFSWELRGMKAVDICARAHSSSFMGDLAKAAIIFCNAVHPRFFISIDAVFSGQVIV